MASKKSPTSGDDIAPEIKGQSKGGSEFTSGATYGVELDDQNVVGAVDLGPSERHASMRTTFYSEESLSKLKDGILSITIPETEKAEAKVKEVIRSQDVVRESIQQELVQLEEYKLTDDIGKIFVDVKRYHAKLTNIKKDMHTLQDKSAKLKRKAQRLQIQKQKEELHKAHQKEKQLELEREITAKPAAEYSTKSK